MLARFGDFELDIANCQLKRGARRIRLAKQPLDLLILLVQRQNGLVTREEIIEALWGGDTFVENSQGINSAILKIRTALRDDASAPRYIETVPRRGYRFIAPVTMLGSTRAPAEVEASPSATAQIVTSEVESSSEAAQHQTTDETPLRQPGNRTALAAMVLLPVLIVAALAVWRKQAARSDAILEWRMVSSGIHATTQIATDGRNVYWTEFDGTGCKPWMAQLEGSWRPEPIPVPFGAAQVADVTQDGRLLLMVRSECRPVSLQGLQGSLHQVDVGSGKTRRLGMLSGQDAAWSPDGSQIALARWDRIQVLKADGSPSGKEIQAPGFSWGPRWSPDSTRIRFGVQPNTEYRAVLHEARIESGRVHRLLPGPDVGSAEGGAWPSEGEYVFGVRKDGGSALFKLADQGDQPPLARLTPGPMAFSFPVALPGEHEILAVGTQRRGELQSFDTRNKQFVPFLRGMSAEMLDFSRDGNWVAYVSYPERDLWRSRLDGSSALQLTHGPLKAGMPRISPDGNRIAFTGDYSGKDMRTWVISFGGGPPQPAGKFEPGTAQVSPTWSPEGRRLLVRLDSALERNHLEIVNLEDGMVELVPDSDYKFNQRWSPDGKWIVATPNNQHGIDVYDVGRRRWIRVSEMKADYPNWSTNSDFISFTSRLNDGTAAIYRVWPGSGKTEFVTSLSGTERAFNEVYNQWAGITPSGSPLILRSLDSRQIFRGSWVPR